MYIWGVHDEWKLYQRFCGFVAVAAGEGVKNLFMELGCTHVVSGGQSMNPSTDDIYEAILATPAKNVIVLPNNKNIILAAEQTIPRVKDRNVVIVPTRTIPQGMTAMLNFDPEISAESNAQLMIDAAHAVGTGLVTFAARNSEFGGRKIKEGDIILEFDGKPIGQMRRLPRLVADTEIGRTVPIGVWREGR